jgi:hypothetical protein
MDDLTRFCVRMLGDGPAAKAAEERTRADADADRIAMLRAAAAAIRESPVPEASDGDSADPEGLSEAVARELAAATARLPLAERELLALRELLGLSYDEIAGVAGVDVNAVPLLVARARLDLRGELRGAGVPQPPCDERERAMRTIARRQDGEAVPVADDDWLIDHLGHCRGCRQAHAAMLEASACYRAWASPEAAESTISAS